MYRKELMADMESNNYENCDRSNAGYENYDIDRAAFGAFVATQRKEKGYTQKELADRLFVSDKAVSKWERGLSFPDISLLVPLSQALDVTVMELLQGRKFEAERKDDLRLDLSEVEQLVKRAVMFSEETNEEKKLRRKKNGPIFAKLLAVSVAEVIVCAVLLFYILANERNPLYINCITCFGTLEILGIVFGVHIWLFMKDRLPSYYDENRISEYADGMFRMSMPGLYFNNKNWKSITVVLKKWNAAVLVGVPLWCIFMLLFIKEWSVALTFSLVVLVISLFGLFVPVYVAGRKKGA